MSSEVKKAMQDYLKNKGVYNLKSPTFAPSKPRKKPYIKSVDKLK